MSVPKGTVRPKNRSIHVTVLVVLTAGAVVAALSRGDIETAAFVVLGAGALLVWRSQEMSRRSSRK